MPIGTVCAWCSDCGSTWIGAVTSGTTFVGVDSGTSESTGARRRRVMRTSVIAAMSAQLQAFDQQLAVFEKILDPLVEWSSSWARLEEAVGDFVRREPPPEG